MRFAILFDRCLGFLTTSLSNAVQFLSDSSRRVSVGLLDNEFRRYARKIGGMKFRRVGKVCLSMLFLMSLMAGTAYCWTMRRYSALGIAICSALGFLIVVLLPWNRLLPGFVLYQRYSPFFLIRHVSQISVLVLVASLAGIPLFYFLSRNKRWRFGSYCEVFFALAPPLPIKSANVPTTPDALKFTHGV